MGCQGQLSINIGAPKAQNWNHLHKPQYQAFERFQARQHTVGMTFMRCKQQVRVGFESITACNEQKSFDWFCPFKAWIWTPNTWNELCKQCALIAQHQYDQCKCSPAEAHNHINIINASAAQQKHTTPRAVVMQHKLI